jgi:ribonuclease HIII
LSELAKALKKYKDMYDVLSNCDFNISEYKLISYGLQFTVQKGKWSGIVRVFQNKKGEVKVDLSQLDTNEYSTQISSLLSVKASDSTCSDGLSGVLGIRDVLPIIGSDESGKGDFFGSLVIASIYVDENTAIRLNALGVKDSKILSQSKILEIARKIRSICKERFSIIEISPEKYNHLYDQIRKEKKNLNDLLAWGHAKAIEDLLTKVDCKIAIIDKFADERIVLAKLQERGKQLEIIQMQKAEANVAVAAASILARERFIQKLSQLSKLYKIDLPKGVSQEVVKAGKFLVEQYGESALKKVAKLHFKTTQEVLE